MYSIISSFLLSVIFYKHQDNHCINTNNIFEIYKIENKMAQSKEWGNLSCSRRLCTGRAIQMEKLQWNLRKPVACRVTFLKTYGHISSSKPYQNVPSQGHLDIYIRLTLPPLLIYVNSMILKIIDDYKPNLFLFYFIILY